MMRPHTYIQSITIGKVLFIIIAYSFHAISFASATNDSTVNNKSETISDDSCLSKDSLNIKELQEYVVKGKKFRMEGNKLISTPSKSDKNLSNSPATLVDVMNIPGLIVNDNIITSYGGGTIPIYINGIPATDTDIATFNTKDVSCVEHIVNPTDPKYGGNSEVINFVMKKYQVGGLTSIDLTQIIPNDGFYTLASKAVYKSMTYAAKVSAGYSRDHSNDESGTTHYKDFYYDSEHYDDVTCQSNTNNWNRNNYVNGVFSARWAGKNGWVNHSAGYAWNQDPGSGNNIVEQWSPNILNSNSSSSRRTGLSLSPQIKGSYYFTPTEKFIIESYWTYKYTHNNSFSSYQAESHDPIFNRIKEDVNLASFIVTPHYNVNKYVQFILNCGWWGYWYDTKYSGSEQNRIKQTRGESRERLLFLWNPSKKFNLVFVPGLMVEYWEVGERKMESQASFTAEFYANWSISSKVRLSGNVSFSEDPVNASQGNDALIRQSEILWLQGNPDLKTSKYWSSNIKATWLCSDMFTIGGYIGWSRPTNIYMITYSSAPQDMEGLIGKYSNIDYIDQMYGNLYLDGRFFNNKLKVSLNPGLDYTKFYGEYKRDKASFRINAKVSYVFGDFMARVSYRRSTPKLLGYDMSMTRFSDDLDFQLTWGKNNFYASVKIMNILHSSKSYKEYNSQHYSYNKCEIRSPFQAVLSFSYLISYGKKTDQSIDAGDVSTCDSGALK